MRSMIVIRSYLKKSRLQVAVIVLMLLIASLVMGISSALLTDYKANFFRMHDRLNAEHVVLDYADIGDGGKKYITEKLTGDSGISSFEITPAAFAEGSCPYGEDGTLTSVFAAVKISDAEDKSIGKFEIIDEADVGEGYVPYIFKANGFCKTGDTFTVSSGKAEESFVIKGFYNNLTTGTVNCRDVVLLLTDEKYGEFVSDGFAGGYRVSVRLTEPEQAETLEPYIISRLSEDPSGIVFIDSVNYIKLSNVRYISETVFTGVLCSAAAVITIVLLAVIAVSLTNYIKENMRNLGIMKAVGYESRRLSGPIILLLTLLAGIASGTGYILSYCLLPMVNSILESQSGIPYEVHILRIPAIVTVGVMLVSVFVTAVLSIRKIRTILPIMAIRPAKTGAGAMNALPLQKAKTGLDLTLGLKAVFAEPGKYLVFLLTSCLITVMLCVAAYSVDNILNHPGNIIRMVMGNTADVSLSVSASDEEKLLTWFSDRDDVEDAYVYTGGSVCHEGGGRIDTVIRDSEGSRLSEYLLTEGTLPETDSEVAVNFAYADSMGLKIGDEMTFTKDGNRQTYRICGLFQDASSSGKNIAMLRNGYEKLTKLTSVSYLVDLADGADIDDFISEACDDVPVSGINYRRLISGLSATYISMLSVLIVIIVIVSMLIAAMVLSIIVNMILFNRRREHGIMKSLGFVTGQIVFQTAVSFVPAAVCGSAIGLLISYRGVSSLFSCFVRSVGIYSFGDSISPSYLAACGILFTAFTFAVTCLLSMKIRKVVPHDLFNNE